jgi:hypothetical protein
VVTEGDQFVPMLDARMTLSGSPGIEFTGELILVNRAQVEAMWEEGE